MKTLIAGFAALAIVGAFGAAAQAQAPAQSKPVVAGQSKLNDQANCSFTYNRYCNGYCWVCS
jgi:hypothetical protein